jgi:hypothetical protein
MRKWPKSGKNNDRRHDIWFYSTDRLDLLSQTQTLMKRILFLFVLLVTAGIANAQTAQPVTTPTAQERAHSYAVRMQKQLALTEEQTTSVEAVALAKYNAIDAVKADPAKTQEQKDAEIAQIKSEKQKEILALLTPEQVTKYNEIRQQREQRKETINGQQSEE